VESMTVPLMVPAVRCAYAAGTAPSVETIAIVKPAIHRLWDMHSAPLVNCAWESHAELSAVVNPGRAVVNRDNALFTRGRPIVRRIGSTHPDDPLRNRLVIAVTCRSFYPTLRRTRLVDANAPARLQPGY